MPINTNNVKSFKDVYYIENTIWTRHYQKEKIETFSLKFTDSIILHFDFTFSIFKAKSMYKKQINLTKTELIDCINVCLRQYQKIRQLYPYNDVFVIIYVDNIGQKLFTDLNFFKSVIDILPNFAITSNKQNQDLAYIFNNKNYKHIFYGNFMDIIKNYNIDYQNWKIIRGKLYIIK